MSEIVVYPEQISFVPKKQKTNRRVRVTIKNLGNMPAKVVINPPETDSFTVTDPKGKIIDSQIKCTLQPESTEFIFVQKNADVAIVPDDNIVITSGKKTVKVVLRPAVSLVSVEELEAAVREDEQIKPTKEKKESKLSKGSKQTKSVVLTDGDEEREIPSRSSFKRSTKNTNSDDLVFSEEDFGGRKPKSARESRPASSRSLIVEDEQDQEIERASRKAERTGKECKTPTKSEHHSEHTSNLPVRVVKRGLPKPAALREDPSLRTSGVPKREVDVLTQSMHLKLHKEEESDEDDTPHITKKPVPPVPWYDESSFAELDEPDYSFELMMTKPDEDPVFCIDGDYYDPSGRLLTVQQGKAQPIFVTEQNQKKGL